MGKDIWLITDDDFNAIVAATTFEKAVTALVDRKYITAHTRVWYVDNENCLYARAEQFFGSDWKDKVKSLTLNEFMGYFDEEFSVQFVPFVE